jgi:hypothetical protein
VAHWTTLTGIGDRLSVTALGSLMFSILR